MENTRYFDEGTGNKGTMKLENNRFIFSAPLLLKGIKLNSQSVIKLDGNHSIYEITLNDDATLFAPDILLPFDNFAVIIEQGAFGDKELSFSDEFLFESGIAPTITAITGSFDVLNCIVTSDKKILTTVIQNFI